jgi:hypothetical protein
LHAALPLLQRRADVDKLGAQIGADAVDDGHDHDAEAGCNHAIFDRGRAGFIVEKFLD